MKVPIEVAVAWFTEDTRRLFSLSRSLVNDTALPRLEGQHLFLSAARMDEGVAGLVIPAKAREILADTPLSPGSQNKRNHQQFLKISLVLKEACCSVAEYSRPIEPAELLFEVFGSDRDTRVKLGSILGERLLTHLGNKLLLARFDPDEIEKLLRLRKGFPKKYV